MSLLTWYTPCTGWKIHNFFLRKINFITFAARIKFFIHRCSKTTKNTIDAAL